MNQSLKPKSDFQKTTFTKTLETLAVTEGFRNACSQTLLSYLGALPTTNDTVEAAANWHRMEGALEAIDTLLNLAEIPKPPDKKPDYNLKT